MTTQDAGTDAAIEQLAAEILYYELIATFLYQYYPDEVEKQQDGELYFPALHRCKTSTCLRCASIHCTVTITLRSRYN
jgi:hypothetical protein